MGAPPNPIDGQKYAELLLGVPMVLEYDNTTGGFKLVIDVENSLEVTMTGIVVSIDPSVEISNWPVFGAQYLEDDPFVGGSTGTMVLAVRTDRMQSWVDADGDFATLNVDAMGRLYTWTTGSYTFADTEMSAPIVLDDDLPNPTAGGVGAYALGFNAVTGNWQRLRVDPVTAGLLVSITGSVDTELPPAEGLTDTFANPTVPGVGAFGMAIDPIEGTWRRVRVDPSTFGLLVSITGTASVDTELPAAVALSDALGNPTAPAVGAYNLGWNAGGGTWERLGAMQYGSSVEFVGGTAGRLLPVGAALFGQPDNGSTILNALRLDPSRNLRVTMISGAFPPGAGVDILADLPLVATEDEVTAYITGTTALNLMGKTIVRAPIDISGSAAGEETVIAAVGGQKIKVLETMLIGNADASVFFQSGFTGTALTGPLSLPSDGDGFFIPTPAQIEAHHFETIAGEALVLDIDANVLLGGWINYYTEA